MKPVLLSEEHHTVLATVDQEQQALHPAKFTLV
jgi:hypothetical protein